MAINRILNSYKLSRIYINKQIYINLYKVKQGIAHFCPIMTNYSFYQT